MVSISTPFLCAYCTRLIRNGDYNPDEFFCDAFPDGIPAEIINSDVDHRLPYKGDQGIQYEFDGDLFDEEPEELYRELDKK